jgi:hypothetical protein
MANYKDIKNYLGLPQVQPVGLFKKDDPTNIYWFSTEPTIEVDMEKIITRKTVLKRGNVDGTVKELFSTGDYQITIEGILTGQDDKGYKVYPSVDVDDLVELMEIEDNIGIVCELTNTFNIGLMVVSRFRSKRVGNTFQYTIFGYSDRDILVTDA